IPAVRGKILDRNGFPFAENKASYNISIYLEELGAQFKTEYDSRYAIATGKNKIKPSTSVWNSVSDLCGKLLGHKKADVITLTKEDRSELEWDSRYAVVSNIAQNVSGILKETVTIDPKKFKRHYETRRVLPMAIVENLTPAQIARFQEQPSRPLGTDIELQAIRNYPYGDAAAHLLGYIIHDSSSATDEDSFFDYRLEDYRGVVGIEGSHDGDLRGKAGAKALQINHKGYRQSEMVWEQSEPGKNVVMTIDRNIQLAAEAAMRRVPTMRGLPVRGAVVVMDVRNGDVIAMVSAPAYSPSEFADGLTPEEAARLSDEKQRPQVNRATAGIYASGSVFKIVTALAALEAGVLDPNEIYASPGIYPIGPGIHDLAPPGNYDFRLAFIKSSNCYFIEYGLRAKFEKVMDMGNRLFLGEKCGVPQDTRGFFPNPTWIESERKQGRYWSRGDTANLCIGQGQIAVTPMQVAVMISAVANGGKVFYPRLVQRIEPQDPLKKEEQTEEFPTRLRGELGVQKKNLDIVRAAMRDDVADPAGSGKFAVLPDFQICGKTGTAQVKRGRITIDDITWFASFGPYENPRFAVIVMVESGSSGGGTCGPIARDIYKAIQLRENPVQPKKEVFALTP
ncbi:MAG: hypothetical protein JWN25_29, partial [Verrucomicrobiales bacterium]|nr:hypothetical protein [Verrucomicrobiales bacterium]